MQQVSMKNVIEREALTPGPDPHLLMGGRILVDNLSPHTVQY